MFIHHALKIFFPFWIAFCCHCAKAQNTFLYFDDQEIPILDPAFTYQETTQNTFIKTNSATLWNLREQITQLPFDHCNHPDVSMLIYGDSKASLPIIQMVKGTSLTKVDSFIIMLTQNSFSQCNVGGLHHNLIYMKFKFHNARIETLLATTGGNYDFSVLLSGAFGILDSLINRDYRGVYNECEDDAFFYKEGMKSLKDSSYKKAIYNFTQSLQANPLDMEASYQLGLAYQKTGKMKKACECYSKGADAGDSNAINAFRLFCQQSTSK